MSRSRRCAWSLVGLRVERAARADLDRSPGRSEGHRGRAAQVRCAVDAKRAGVEDGGYRRRCRSRSALRPTRSWSCRCRRSWTVGPREGAVDGHRVGSPVAERPAVDLQLVVEPPRRCPRCRAWRWRPVPGAVNVAPAPSMDAPQKSTALPTGGESARSRPDPPLPSVRPSVPVAALTEQSLSNGTSTTACRCRPLRQCPAGEHVDERGADVERDALVVPAVASAPPEPTSIGALAEAGVESCHRRSRRSASRVPSM